MRERVHMTPTEIRALRLRRIGCVLTVGLIWIISILCLAAVLITPDITTSGVLGALAGFLFSAGFFSLLAISLWEVF